jgi:hypothetical protein
MQLMVRRLLAERFSLKTHLETRELPRDGLVMSRGDRRLGPRLRPSKIDCPAIIAARGPDYRPPTDPPQPGDPPRCTSRFRIGGGSHTRFIEGQPMSAIASARGASRLGGGIPKEQLLGVRDQRARRLGQTETGACRRPLVRPHGRLHRCDQLDSYLTCNERGRG